ncbi:MAG: PQQ-binding-like beta-propeller repeat protein [Planctomyces sp.]|nr:PQQ-binding-like beta-propeller repeat protein [Planctomyces sp.]
MPSYQLRSFIVSACVMILAGSTDAQTNWPQFRGEGARGIADNAELPDRWTTTENVAWKTEIPGRGWSSPVVWGDKVILTSVVNQGAAEDPKKGLYFGGERLVPPDAIHQWKVFCLNLQDGSTIWEKQVHEGKPESSIHIKNTFASETPVTDGKHVYCCFGNLGIFCFDFDGNLVWQHKLQPHATRFGWGTAASPVLFDGRLYLVDDNEDESSLICLNSETGEQIWKRVREEKSNWSTPYIWQNSVRTEIVTPGTGQVRSYDLDGNLLWSLEGMSSITIATPYQAEGLLYVTSGYVLDPLKPIYAIRPGASGDISLKDGETSSKFIAWSNPKAAPYNPSTLVYEDRLYVLYDRSLVSAFQASTGKELFGPERLSNGRAFTASPWAYNQKVFCLNEDGVTFVLKAGDQLEVLHSNELAEDDMAMATPAIVGDRLLIRTLPRIYCIRDRKSEN